jgi:haloacetate dehalogenase
VSSDVTIHCRIGGNGPPLLLLHGCPQTHLMWHKLAPELAKSFTVVAADLRGYGASSKPQGGRNHENYSFRNMAADQKAVMRTFGFDVFEAVGHDRGARVLHRMALDYPQALKRATLLDILPTEFLYAQTDKQFATAYWEWFFFTQKAGFPEALLGADPALFLRYELGPLVDIGVVTDEAWQGYLHALSNPEALYGMCEDYRAGATIDLIHDEADKGRKVSSPINVLWGKKNLIWLRFDMLTIWKQYADNVEGKGLESGHYLAEELPDKVLSELFNFHSKALT